MLNKFGRMFSRSVILVTAMTISGASLAGKEIDVEQPSGDAMVGDLFLMRPLGIVGTILGTATFIVSLPFTAMAGNVGEAADSLVSKPAAHTFTRPLGDM